MFQRKKKEIEFLTKQNQKLIKQYRECRQQCKQSDEKYECLRKLVSDYFFHKLIEIYTVNECEYSAYISHFMCNGDNGFECKFNLKQLSSISRNELATSDVEVKNNYLEIVNLDAYPYRNGYGSKMLEYIEDFAHSHGMKKIFGFIWNNTPIGLENLIRFYEKNGYEIQGENDNWCFFKML